MINQFSAEIQKILFPSLDKVKELHGNLQEMVLLILDHQEAMMMRGMISSSDHQRLELEVKKQLQENLLIEARTIMMEDDLSQTRLRLLAEGDKDTDLVQKL